MNWKLVILVFSFALFSSLAKKKPKSVTTIIDAKWEVTPLALEMSEYLWDENPIIFWKYVDAISNLQPPLVDGRTDKEIYDRCLNVARTLISNHQISLMKFALSLHIYSPRVEMFSQIAVDREIVCPVAADVAGTIVCDSTGLVQAIESAKRYSTPNNANDLLHVDHKYPGNDSSTLVFLYGELGSPEFSVFHNILKQLAKSGEIQYVLRHWIKERPQKRLRLSGYGVELQMKSTEYKVQDDTKVEDRSSVDTSEEEEEVEGFNFSKLKQLYPDKAAVLDKFKQELLESTSELAPLKVWQFQELSLQAAQRIMSAPKEEALNVMLHIAQNFPTQAKSLVKTVVSYDLKNEIKQNQEGFAATLHLQPSDTGLFLNGMYFDMEIQDIFTILDYIRQELKIMEGLKNIGFSEKKVFKSLVGLDLANQAGEYALDIRDSAVNWLNDIETDESYRRWSSSLMDLLRPTFPGILRSVRKNLYNLVLIGDPSEASVQPLVRLMQSFLVHNAPLRVGLVFSIKPDKKIDLEDPGLALLKCYNYISEIRDANAAINFITDVYVETTEKNITVDIIKNTLNKNFRGASASEVLGVDSDYLTGFDLSADFVSRSGFRKMPQVLLNGVPLAEKNLNADDFEEAVLSEIMHQTPTLQKAIYKGELTDKDDVTEYLMTRPNVMPRLNERVLSTVKNDYVDFTDPSNDILSKIINNHIFYATYKSEDSKKISFITNWIVCDLSNEISRNLLTNAIAQMESSGSVRISLIVNCKSSKGCHIINKLALLALRAFPPNVASKKLSTLIEKWSEIKDSSDVSLDENILGIKNSDWSEIDESIDLHRKFLDEVLNFKASSRGIISNGRVLGPFDEEEEFVVDDFNLLERFSTSAYVEKIHKSIMANSEVADYLSSDMLMKTVSLLASRPESKNRFEINPVGDQHSVLKLSAVDSEQPSFDLVAIVDPVSSGAHKLASVLSVLHQVVNADIRIFMNCVEKSSDMPLKSFYRYVLEPEIQFTETGQQGWGPMAKFSNMPGAPLLTQNMLVPDNWFVESIASPHDLDNIRLDQVDSNVHSQFELEYLILDGHCFDFQTGSPPRGLQITLDTNSKPNQFDTIVMANLGYFQLKSNPGAWKLQLREGRSTELYDIVGASHDGVDLTKNGNEVKVLMSSLKAHTVKLKVIKKPDMVGMDLLGDDSGDGQQGIWDSITSTFGGSKEESKDPQDNVINIFSVASGHLYERFLRIMMLSVLKNTKSPVKFWFLKNYLSPTFKDFLPTMASQYGFQYELVQYKWPRWLHQQTEKQRIIWGYKILFLDVLFPLNIKKIIFVDADQVVRTDLKELVDFDLNGAPYGYTPFCDSRKEMDGFRFWKSGYWRNHLQGRKYHISALYVVDLKRFRRVAAGDRLRGQYQALSQDPNSLSNLDQDLPNNMIHQVAIKSLPQEWLWCETWCDDSSKDKAKTIDLCNNPLTKEAKLSAAMRILPEWKDYDEEIKRLQLRLGETDDHEEEHPSLSKTDRKQRHPPHSEL